eukprot:g34703.t1
MAIQSCAAQFLVFAPDTTDRRKLASSIAVSDLEVLLDGVVQIQDFFFPSTNNAGYNTIICQPKASTKVPPVSAIWRSAQYQRKKVNVLLRSAN